jgi:putative NADPH-quinone reductase
MPKITVIDGHPDPARAHLVHALAERYAQSAQEAGNEVRRITVADLDFPLLRVPADFWHGKAPETLRRSQADLAWADHLAFFYPLWMIDMPALLQAFLEQTFRPGLAIEYGTGRMRPFKRLFLGKTARIIVTMGMPPPIYRAIFGALTLRAFAQMLRFTGVGPVRVSLFGGLRGDAQGGHEDADARTAQRWIETMPALAAKDTRLHGHRPVPVVTALEVTLLVATAASVLARLAFGGKHEGRREHPRLIVERSSVGAKVPDELQAIASESYDALRETGAPIEWVESIVTDDKIYAIFRADDKTLISEFARPGKTTR